MERLFLQLIKKKLTSLDKLPPLKFQKKSPPPPPPIMSCLKSWFPPFTKGGRNYANTDDTNRYLERPVNKLKMLNESNG